MSFGPTTPAESQAHIEDCIAAANAQPRSRYELAVVLRAEERLIGNVNLQPEPREPRHAAFSYLLHRDYWGKGYATEAMHALFDFGFHELGLHRVADTCDVRNVASARVMEKLGLRREAHFRETVWKDGRWHDEYLYAILAHEWASPPTSPSKAAGS